MGTHDGNQSPSADAGAADALLQQPDADRRRLLRPRASAHRRPLGPWHAYPGHPGAPYAKNGFVDHTQYDTASALRFITSRFVLPTLPGLQQRDTARLANKGQAMGDVTNAPDFTAMPH